MQDVIHIFCWHETLKRIVMKELIKMHFLKKISWIHYVFTFIIFLAIYLTGHGSPPIDIHFFYDSSSIFMIFIISIFTAISLGYKNAHLKWLYSVYSPALAWLVPIAVADFFLHHYIESDAYYFGYYIVFCFILFVVQLILTLLSLALGSALKKREAKS